MSFCHKDRIFQIKWNLRLCFSFGIDRMKKFFDHFYFIALNS